MSQLIHLLGKSIISQDCYNFYDYIITGLHDHNIFFFSALHDILTQAADDIEKRYLCDRQKISMDKEKITEQLKTRKNCCKFACNLKMGEDISTILRYVFVKNDYHF